jgi:prepilin-type N-terminal cleavage/methylation domain-containing protein
MFKLSQHYNTATPSSTEKGFTLLEVMVSLLLFLVVSAIMASSYVGHLKRSTETEVRTLAMGAAQEILDETRLVDPDSLPSSGSTSTTVVVGGRSFGVESTYCSNATYCASPANRHIRVRVNFQGVKVFETETVFTRLR